MTEKQCIKDDDWTNDFQTRISSQHRLFDFHLKEVLQYRDLTMLFVKRDFIALYKQTILGPAWAVLQPLLTTVVFTLIFGRLAGLTTSDTDGSINIPAFMFYMAGSTCWNFFSSVTKKVSDAFIFNQNIMGKVYYPRIVTPIASAFSRFISFAIQFSFILCFWLYFLIKGGTDIRLTPAFLLIIPVIIHIMLLGVAVGIIVASATIKYRDLEKLMDFGMSLWQYASPVAYGLALIHGSYRSLYMLNPVTPIITTFRYALFGQGLFDIRYCLISWGITFVLLIAGLVLFNSLERTFMDII